MSLAIHSKDEGKGNRIFATRLWDVSRHIDAKAMVLQNR